LRVDNLFHLLGIEAWKAVLTGLMLPPVPWLVLMLVGARMILWRRGVGWLAILLAVAGLWLGSTTAIANWLQRALLPFNPALNEDRITEIKQEVAARHDTVIVVLGGGRETLAPEYGVSNLSPYSIERLRYGVWLARLTGAPLGFTGGVGHGQAAGLSEAEVAARIAAQEFGLRLKWTEGASRDTRENGSYTVALLRNSAEKPHRVLLVTHGWHMARAKRAFEEAAAKAGYALEVVPAPIGLAQGKERQSMRWLPSSEGFELTRAVLRERVGLLAGA
jgi:uncharacterized SAM-binding protein YcdF (DUF218 family)